jgi:hypothetical protein
MNTRCSNRLPGMASARPSKLSADLVLVRLARQIGGAVRSQYSSTTPSLRQVRQLRPASDARLATLFAKQAATATCALGGSNPRGIERKSMSNPAMLKIVARLSRTTSSMGIYRANAYSGRHLHRAARPGSRCRPASHFPRERFITAVIAIRQERLCTTTRPAVP